MIEANINYKLTPLQRLDCLWRLCVVVIALSVLWGISIVYALIHSESVKQVVKEDYQSAFEVIERLFKCVFIGKV